MAEEYQSARPPKYAPANLEMSFTTAELIHVEYVHMTIFKHDVKITSSVEMNT